MGPQEAKPCFKELGCAAVGHPLSKTQPMRPDVAGDRNPEYFPRGNEAQRNSMRFRTTQFSSIRFNESQWISEELDMAGWN